MEVTMKINKIRHLAILNHIIKQEGLITSENLSLITDASVRTIKNDICELNDMLMAENIATIVSTRSKGYQLQPLDMTLFEEFKLYCMQEYAFYRNSDIEKTNRRLFIAQKLLSNECVHLQDLADDLFLTKSAIKEDMAWVTTLFESYNVTINSASYKGMFLEGSEYNLRCLMVEVFCNQYYTIDSIKMVENFPSCFIRIMISMRTYVMLY